MLVVNQSLRSRGIRFPGRDNESLAPIFTPARSVSASASELDDANLLEQLQRDAPALSFSPEQTKEAFEVARNSIELLSTVLSSSPHEDVMQVRTVCGLYSWCVAFVNDKCWQDELASTLIQQCRQAQATVVRIIETAGENEALLFEALNVNDEIQKVVAKYEELQPAVVSAEPEPAMIPVAVEPEESPRHTNEEESLVRKQPSGSRPAGDDMMDDLDEMIFGKKKNKEDSKKDDLISF